MKMFNKLTPVLLIFIFSLSVITFPVMAEEGIKVALNGKEILFDVPPQIINDHTLVPMRALFEKFGYNVGWAEGTKTVTATKPDGTSNIVIQIDKSIAQFNHKDVELDCAPTTVEDRTMVPLRFVGECANYDVLWYDKDNTVLIYDKAPPYTNAEEAPTYKGITAGGGWIYWASENGIVRAKEDGSNCEWVLHNTSCNDLIANGDFIYGRLSEGSSGIPKDLHLRSYNTVTKEFKDLSNQNVRDIKKIGDWIEYGTFDANGGIRDTKRYKVKIDGTQTTEITNVAQSSPYDYEGKNPLGNWTSKKVEYKGNTYSAMAHYTSEAEPLKPIGIYCTDSDGKVLNFIADTNQIDEMVIINDTICFTENDGKDIYNNNLFRMNLDGICKVKIASNICSDFSIIGGYIYLSPFSKDDLQDGNPIKPRYRMRTDGGKIESLVDAWNIQDWDTTTKIYF